MSQEINIGIALDDNRICGRVKPVQDQQPGGSFVIATTALSETALGETNSGGYRWLLSEPPGYAAEDLYRGSQPDTQKPSPVFSRTGLEDGLSRTRVGQQRYDHDYLAILTRALLARLQPEVSASIDVALPKIAIDRALPKIAIDVAAPAIGALLHPRSQAKTEHGLMTFNPDNKEVRDSLVLAFSGSGVGDVEVRWAHALIRDILEDCRRNQASSLITPELQASVDAFLVHDPRVTATIMIAELHLGGIAFVPVWRHEQHGGAFETGRKSLFIPFKLDQILDDAFVSLGIANYENIAYLEREAIRRDFFFPSPGRAKHLKGLNGRALEDYLHVALVDTIYAQDRDNRFQNFVNRFALTDDKRGAPPSITVLGLALTGTLANHSVLGPALEGALARLFTGPELKKPQTFSFFRSLDTLAELALAATNTSDVSAKAAFWYDVRFAPRDNSEGESKELPLIVSQGRPQRRTIEVSERNRQIVLTATRLLDGNKPQVDIIIDFDLQEYQLGRAIEAEARIDKAEQIVVQLYIDGGIYRGGSIKCGNLPQRNLGQGRFAICADAAHQRLAETIARVADDANGEPSWRFIKVPESEGA